MLTYMLFVYSQVHSKSTGHAERRPATWDRVSSQPTLHYITLLCFALLPLHSSLPSYRYPLLYYVFIRLSVYLGGSIVSPGTSISKASSTTHWKVTSSGPEEISATSVVSYLNDSPSTTSW
jgi:hypothetical protein